MRILGYIALLLWFALAYKYYIDHKAGCSKAATLASSSQKACPVCFEWGSPNPQLCNNWEAFRDSTINDLNSEEYLLINTSYNPLESKDAELGRNRAISIRALFNGYLAEERIKIHISKNQVPEHADCQVKSRLESASESENLKQENDSATLHLGNMSVSANPEVRGYLDDIAKRVKKSGEKVRIVGHTDSDGSEVSNIKLGFNQAEEVKSYLISLGVAKENLITISKGENNPLEGNTNSTEEEKAANRRIEIIISNS